MRFMTAAGILKIEIDVDITFVMERLSEWLSTTYPIKV
ncbi:hypothetical protein DFR78_10445 [Halanaerobium sp. MA284_MarDTE_T2]|nr:hypothetical protein DFR78_10445 [Halanaerobium sp. MA284_MarDTE_T2]RCW88519.1 hypothetical protein DER71_10347 [Halanaerobium sp. DL-01]